MKFLIILDVLIFLFLSVLHIYWAAGGTRYSKAVIPQIRAIGDFKYVGVFKKVQRTGFARNDTKIYTPLCVIIATISFLIAN